jgi:hypothetical protein
MPRRLMYADALARLLFARPLQDLSPTQRAELDVLRALDMNDDDEESYEALALDWPEEAGDVTVH